MPTIFEDISDKDPLELVVKNKDIVRHLRGNGIDGAEIRKMLNYSHGLKMEWPILMSKAEKEKRKQTDYALRWTTDLIKSDVTTDAEKKSLCEIYNRLWHELPTWEKGKSGAPVYKMPVGDDPGDAISDKQMTGRQVVAIRSYVMKFNGKSRHAKAYSQNAIFDLIAELFEVCKGRKYTRAQIINFDKNNC